MKYINRKTTVVIGLAVGILLAGLIAVWISGKRTARQQVRYGITPYQDTALPVVAEELGWYRENGIDVEFIPLAWGDVVNAIAGGSIDVALYNFNSFQAPYENAAQGNIEPVFYAAMYVFKGAAIMIHQDSGMEPFRDIPGESEEQRKERIREAAHQLKGKRIAVTQGTEYEQIVLAALDAAELDAKKEVTLIHATPEDALAAFLAKDIDAFGAGLTERVEARRHGGIKLLVAADVSPPVIDGLITSEEFAREHQELLDKLVVLWFRTIQFMEKDLAANSKYVLGYLTRTASTRYTPDEYQPGNSILWDSVARRIGVLHEVSDQGEIPPLPCWLARVGICQVAVRIVTANATDLIGSVIGLAGEELMSFYNRGYLGGVIRIGPPRRMAGLAHGLDGGLPADHQLPGAVYVMAVGWVWAGGGIFLFLLAPFSAAASWDSPAPCRCERFTSPSRVGTATVSSNSFMGTLPRIRGRSELVLA